MARPSHTSCEERQELKEAEAAVTAEAAALKRRGWPKILSCLVCGRSHSAASPGDRLHEACRRSAGEW